MSSGNSGGRKNLSSGGIQIKNDNEDEIEVPTFPSEFIFNGRSTFASSIRIEDAEANGKKYFNDSRDFPSSFDLSRTGSDGYKLIIRLDSRTFFKVKLRKLKEVEDYRQIPNCLNIVFSHEHWYRIVFKFRQNYLYYKTYFRRYLELLNDLEDTEEIEEVDTKQVIATRSYGVMLDNEPPKKKSSGFFNNLINSVLSYMGTNQSPKFFLLDFEDWNHIHKVDWFKHIPYQDAIGSPVKNVYQVFRERDMLEMIQESFIFNEEASVETLLEEIIKFEKRDGSHDPGLNQLMNVDRLRRTLKIECEMIEENHRKYNMKFHNVLQKHIKQTEKANQAVVLDRLKEILFEDARYQWSVEDCRDFILFLLLFKEKIHEYFDQAFKDFKDLEKKMQRRNDFEELDPKEWERRLLLPFNKKVECDLHLINFRVWTKYQRNELRKELKELEKELKKIKKKKKGHSEEMWSVNDKITTTLEKIDRENRLLLAVMLERPENEELQNKNKEKIKELESFVSEKKFELHKMEEEMKKLEESKKEKKNRKEVLRVQILNCTPVRRASEKRKFYISKERREAIRRMFLKKIDQLIAQKNIENPLTVLSKEESKRIEMERRSGEDVKVGKEEEENEGEGDEEIMEIGVKLVISMFEGFTTSKFMKVGSSWLDFVLKPGFYRWGFVHPNILIANVGIHWFASAIVGFRNLSAKQKYREIVALDTSCTIFFTRRTIFEVCTSLAEYIVGRNVNYDYCFYDISGQSDRVNCQEFTYEMLKKLKHSSTDFFFPIVERYLDDLKNMLASLDKHASTDKLRFITLEKKNKKKKRTSSSFSVSPDDYLDENKEDELDFRTRFKEVLEMKPFVPDKKRRVYFPTHASVDLFYSECLKIDNHFQMNYPGIHQLLKGFDRAFWIQREDQWDIENIDEDHSNSLKNKKKKKMNLRSGGRNPFSDVEFFRKRGDGRIVIEKGRNSTGSDEKKIQELKDEMEEWKNCPFSNPAQGGRVDEYIEKLLEYSDYKKNRKWKRKEKMMRGEIVDDDEEEDEGEEEEEEKEGEGETKQKKKKEEEEEEEEI